MFDRPKVLLQEIIFRGRGKKKRASDDRRGAWGGNESAQQPPPQPHARAAGTCGWTLAVQTLERDPPVAAANVPLSGGLWAATCGLWPLWEHHDPLATFVKLAKAVGPRDMRDCEGPPVFLSMQGEI